MKRPRVKWGIYEHDGEPETLDELFATLKPEDLKGPRENLIESLELCDRTVAAAQSTEYRHQAAELGQRVRNFRGFWPKLAGDPKLADVLLLEALTIGAAFERLRVNLQVAGNVRAGAGTRRGGKKSAERKHGPHAERHAKWEQWIARFAELRRQFPEAKKKALLGMIQTETGETHRTLRRYIKAR